MTARRTTATGASTSQRVDPHLGTNDDFAAFADCAHRLGLKVYLDVVVNHTADVISSPAGLVSSARRVPYRNCRGRPYKARLYAGGKAFPCLSTAISRGSRVLQANRSRRSRRGSTTSSATTTGATSTSRAAATCASSRATSSGSTTSSPSSRSSSPGWPGVRRLDPPVQARRLPRGHGESTSTGRSSARGRRRSGPRPCGRRRGLRDLRRGDDHGRARLSRPSRRSGRSRTSSTSRSRTRSSATQGRRGPAGIETRLADDDYFRAPKASRPHRRRSSATTTWAGRPPDPRAAGAAGAELLQRVLLGHSLLFLLRGAPVVYYGDEVGMIGAGGDKAARQDMFPTQVAEWRTEERVGSPPIGTGSSFDVPHPVADHLRRSARSGRRTRRSRPARRSCAWRTGVLAVSRIDRERAANTSPCSTPARRRRTSPSDCDAGARWQVLLGPAQRA